MRLPVVPHRSPAEGGQPTDMSRPALIPNGCWPPRMQPEVAAAYVGERTAESFLSRVGSEYPPPVVDEGTGKGRRRLWLKRDLDRAIGLASDSEKDPPVADF